MATEEQVIGRCSFCLRPNTEVGKLVAGPGVYICDDCVGLCVHVIETTPDSLQRLAPWEHDLPLSDVLVSLPRVAAAGAQVEETLVQWVLKARSLGASWARIGEALGMTRQSAWERFSGQSPPPLLT